jgi:ubiquinone/menaquinone biosynthesis C-methylase UbiE
MYLLDKDYRILDWNRAFSLAFDRTMEGRRGMSVLEWTYFLDNYEEVVAHGVEVFADGDKLPVIDVEQISYTSGRYGPIVATKRAYQVPNDDGSRLGWLVTLEPSFENTEVAVKYRLDLLSLIRMDLVWTEYSLSYDRVLLNTEVYPKLLRTFLGEEGELRPIPDNARVLDLGAGTGNITKELADPSRQRLIFALENNRAMLDVLQSKCKPYLRRDDAGPGVLAIKQDVGSLFGLRDDYFDFALLNNVAYSLDDPQACLRGVRRVLKPGGEVRVSGPQKKTNLDRLFRQIRRDLEAKTLFDGYTEDYERVERINYYSLGPMLYRWTMSDVEQMLVDAGFPEIIWRTDKAYAGQAMIVCAR